MSSKRNSQRRQKKSGTGQDLSSHCREQHRNRNENKTTKEDTDLLCDQNNLADKYQSLAESLYEYGATDLALPFYRQALALAIKERNLLRGFTSSQTFEKLDKYCKDELSTLLRLYHNLSDDADLKVNKLEAEAQESDNDIKERITEIESELTATNARQVITGLETLAEECPGVVNSAQFLSTKGRALMLIDEPSKALECFEYAKSIDPHEPRHNINYAGALLANARHREALEILREMHDLKIHNLTPLEERALTANLASAEHQEGNDLMALRLRHQWLLSSSSDLSAERWLEFCRPGLDQEEDKTLYTTSMQMLKDLQKLKPESREAKETLAYALEKEGELREAAILYRELLRPKQ